MAICGACGKNSLMPEQYGSLTLCKVCALKIYAPTWRDAEYKTNEEVEERRRSVLLRANSVGFPSDALLALDEYFQGRKIDGLVKKIANNVRQTLVLCETYCAVETRDTFDFDEMEQEYKNLAEPKRRLFGRAKTEISPESMSVRIGMSKVDYRLCRGVQLRMPSGNESHGFLRILKEGGSENKLRSILFFFSNSSEMKKFVQEAASFIEDKVDEALSKQDQNTWSGDYVEDETPQMGENSKNGAIENTPSNRSSDSVFEELTKWKKLLDDGVITQEEFSAKKAQILGIADLKKGEVKKGQQYCAECGTKLPDDAQFCPECGAAVS